jgi:electron transfer flavoprotein alpha subunit
MTERAGGAEDGNSGDKAQEPLILVQGQGLKGHLEQVTLELLNDARKMARPLKARVELLLMASAESFEAMKPELSEYVSERIHLLEHPDLDTPPVDATVEVLSEAVQRLSPSVLMMGATTRGRETAPRLGARLGMGYMPHCLTIKPQRNKLTVTRVSHGGRAHQQSTWPKDQPVILTMKPGVGEPPTALDQPAELDVVRTHPTMPESKTRVLELIPPDPKTQDIVEAERIVAGGRGVGGPEGFRVVEDLADALGASVGASRVVADLGWISRERQVGQTGKTVTPELYVAVGISGASHHLAGMKGSEKIVAVNTDPEAPIFQVAHFGTIGDLHEVLPRVARLIRERKQQDPSAESEAQQGQSQQDASAAQ